MGAGGLGGGIGPTVQQDLDKAFRLAIGAGRVGSGAQVPEVVGGAAPPPRVRTIGGAVVGQDGLHRDPLGAEPDQRVVKDGLAVAGPDLGIGQPRMVIDGDVLMLSAGPSAALVGIAVAALADVPESNPVS